MITINEVFAWNRGKRYIGDKMISIKEIKDFAEENECSDIIAKQVLVRQRFCNELKADKSIEDLANTLIKILDYEFGEYNG